MTKSSTQTTAHNITSTRNGTEVLIPLNKLKKSPRNARKTPHSQAAIEAKAASIAAKGILQNLVVEPELDASGGETGFFLVTIGEGRRLAQLLRVKRKQIKKTEPIRCVIDTTNDPHEISLDENVTREAMHPADQFEAFRDLAEQKGWGAEEIAARFGVTPHVVRQRLRLAAVSPRLMQLYRDGELTLDQLMAFALVDDHTRQEQVYDNLSWNKDASTIRRALMETHVEATDRRAVFVGEEAYRDAGGNVLRDLFTEDGGGYFEDVALLERLVIAKLETVAAEVQQEGWKWVSVQRDYPHDHGMSRIYPETVALSRKNEAACKAIRKEQAALMEQYQEQEPPEDVERRLVELEAEAERIEVLRERFSSDDLARSGVLVCLSHIGTARIERGLVRDEDDIPEEASEGGEVTTSDAAERAEPDNGTALPESLIRDLTAHRTLALRLELGEQPAVALLAVTHALAVQAFYVRTGGSCLELRSGSVELGTYAPCIKDSAAARKLAERHEAWKAEMPQDVIDLWAVVAALGEEDRMALLAHCASLTVNAVKQPGQSPRTQTAANKLASAVGLDMTAHWSATEQSYFGRITKAQTLAAVTEAAGTKAAERMAALKKPAMAEAASSLLTGTGWLPLPLRTAQAANDEGSEAA
jgi:ParB family chromosome partitioning protein